MAEQNAQPRGSANVSQVIDIATRRSSKPDSDKSAADYSLVFHRRVIRTFGESLSIKQTARECKIPARVVSEILHARDFVRSSPARIQQGGFRMAVSA